MELSKGAVSLKEGILSYYHKDDVCIQELLKSLDAGYLIEWYDVNLIEIKLVIDQVLYEVDNMATVTFDLDDDLHPIVASGDVSMIECDDVGSGEVNVGFVFHKEL